MAELLRQPVSQHLRSMPAGGDSPGGPDLVQERHFLDYLRVLSKRRWTAIPTFVVVASILLVPTYTAVPLYEASAQLLIETDTQNVVSFQAVVEQEAATTDFYQTQYRILESRALAKATMDTLQLWKHPEFGGSNSEQAEPDNPSRVQRITKATLEAFNAVLRPVMGGVAPVTRKAAPAKPEKAQPGDTATEVANDESGDQSRAVAAFLDRLSVAPVRNSRLVDVKFRATDPKLAADAANALTLAYIRQTQEFRFSASKEATDWLGSQLSEQRKQVEASELALQKYREENNATSTEDPRVTQKLAELGTAVTRAKTDRLFKETLFRQLEAIRGDRAALANFPPVLSNAFIQQLKSQLSDLQRREADLARVYGPMYPELIEIRTAVQGAQAKIDREIASVVQSIQTEYDTAKNQEDRLTAELETQQDTALGLNRKAIGYRALERDAASNRQIFESLLQRTKETSISGELKNNNIRVADAANIPSTPVWPQKGRSLLLAICAGLLMGIVLAFFVDYMDNKIKTPDDIRTDLGVVCLGLIPKISGKDPEGRSPLLNNSVPPNFSEAFRSLRTNVLFAVAEGTNVLALTSTAPGEGKTLVATNFAVSLALAGQRVLLIDADMRRPRVHEVFIVAQQPGLSDWLISRAPSPGSTSFADCCRKSSLRNLWIMPAGQLPPNPAELLSSKRFKEMLVSVRAEYDWVVIDCPPVMAVTDASIIAHLVSGVLFVTAADLTDRPAAVLAIEQLAAAKAILLGAVLNRADVQRNAYFYSPYYKREYKDYYSTPAAS